MCRQAYSSCFGFLETLQFTLKEVKAKTLEYLKTDQILIQT